MNAVQTFEENVKKRLKDIVAELIPEDRWEALVRSTVLEFEKTDLPKLIKAELEKKYSEAIRVEFAKDEWQPAWSTTGCGASEAVKKLLIEAAPLVLASMFGNAMESAVQDMRNRLVLRY
jgi:hypothetical protein